MSLEVKNISQENREIKEITEAEMDKMKKNQIRSMKDKFLINNSNSNNNILGNISQMSMTMEMEMIQLKEDMIMDCEKDIQRAQINEQKLHMFDFESEMKDIATIIHILCR